MAINPYADGCAFIGGKYVPIEEARIPILDTGFKRSDLTYDAEEGFLTSTAGGVMPVTSVNGRTIGNGKPGKITTLIQKRYWEPHDEGPLVTPVDYPD
jgi:branched-subunit amino acid aminotransferase/4-amino-4-deoxychorismate lyase